MDKRHGVSPLPPPESANEAMRADVEKAAPLCWEFRTSRLASSRPVPNISREGSFVVTEWIGLTELSGRRRAWCRLAYRTRPRGVIVTLLNVSSPVSSGIGKLQVVSREIQGEKPGRGGLEVNGGRY